MAVIERWYDQDLSKGVPTRMLGNLYYQDANSIKIGVRVFYNGQPTALDGSISAYCVLADGSTVPINTGTKSGNTAYITLPPSAFNVLGIERITIKNVSNNVVTTLLSAVGVVVQARTSSQTNPGQVVDDWTNQINAKLAQFDDVIQQVDIATVAQTKSYLGIS